jgi:hypothetical protein
LDAAAVIVAITRTTPIVLIPFGSATLISFVAIWWAHHGDRKLTRFTPFGADKFTPDSSDARPAKSVD